MTDPKPLDCAALARARAGRWAGWILRCGPLVARGGDRPLVFDRLADALRAAGEWTNAGAHLGADWKPHRVRTLELDAIIQGKD